MSEKSVSQRQISHNRPAPSRRNRGGLTYKNKKNIKTIFTAESAENAKKKQEKRQEKLKTIFAAKGAKNAKKKQEKRQEKQKQFSPQRAQRTQRKDKVQARIPARPNDSSACDDHTPACPPCDPLIMRGIVAARRMYDEIVSRMHGCIDKTIHRVYSLFDWTTKGGEAVWTICPVILLNGKVCTRPVG